MTFLVTWSTGPAERTRLNHLTLSGPIRLFDDPAPVATICGLTSGPNVRTGIPPVDALVCPVCEYGQGHRPCGGCGAKPVHNGTAFEACTVARIAGVPREDLVAYTIHPVNDEPQE